MVSAFRRRFRSFSISCISLSCLISIASAAATCYSFNGTAIQSSYMPCNSSAPVSMCCHLGDTIHNNGDVCGSGSKYGICGVTGTSLWRESCTDPTWQDPACLRLCVDGAGAYSDAAITACNDGSLCCGKNNATCCTANEGLFVVDNRLSTKSDILSPPDSIPSPSSSSAPSISSSSPSTLSSTSLSTTSPTPSSTLSSISISVSSSVISTAPGTSQSNSISASSTTSTYMSASLIDSIITPARTAPVSSSTSTSNKSSTGISMREKAGIAVGAGILIITLLVVAAFMYRKRQQRKRKLKEQYGGSAFIPEPEYTPDFMGMDMDKKPLPVDTYLPEELDGNWRGHEVEAKRSPVELPGSTFI